MTSLAQSLRASRSADSLPSRPRRSIVPVGWAGLGIALNLSACVDAQDVPAPPSTKALLSAYVAPTGEISEGDVIAIVEDVAQDGPQGVFDDQSYVDRAIGAVADASAGSGGVDLGRLRLSGDAVLQVTVPCQGDAETAGHLQCQITFTPAGLNPSIWGTADACTLQTGHGTLQFDGKFLISLDDVDAFDVNPDAWTAQFEGTIEVDGGTSQSGTIDAQRKDERFVARLPLMNGTWAFLGYDTTKPETLTVTDTEGTYHCDFDTRVCSTTDHPGGDVQF